MVMSISAAMLPTATARAEQGLRMPVPFIFALRSPAEAGPKEMLHYCLKKRKWCLN
jgi:hypothetical protein